MALLSVLHAGSLQCTLLRDRALGQCSPEAVYSQRLLPACHKCCAHSTLGRLPDAGMCRFFDIAVPRNIASDVNSAEASRVFNVDDLKEVVAANKLERRKAAGEAEILLRQEQLSFEAWRDSLETVPTIKVGLLQQHSFLCRWQ